MNTSHAVTETTRYRAWPFRNFFGKAEENHEIFISTPNVKTLSHKFAAVREQERIPSD